MDPGNPTDLSQDCLNAITASQRFPIDPRRSRKSGFYPFNIDYCFPIADALNDPLDHVSLSFFELLINPRPFGLPNLLINDLFRRLRFNTPEIGDRF